MEGFINSVDDEELRKKLEWELVYQNHSETSKI